MESAPVFAGETPTRAAQLPGSGASAFLMSADDLVPRAGGSRLRGTKGSLPTLGHRLFEQVPGSTTALPGRGSEAWAVPGCRPSLPGALGL